MLLHFILVLRSEVYITDPPLRLAQGSDFPRVYA